MQIGNWDQDDKHFIYRVIILFFFLSGILAFSQAFFILFLYSNFGIIEAGKYLIIVNITVFLFDYVTGNLSDSIGQRGVFILALITHAVAFLILVSTNDLIGLYLAGFVQGFALAQFSGTFMTWFDNNYQRISEKYDKDYKIYPILQMRLNVFNTLSRIIYSVIGGYLVLIFDRALGLLIESVLSFASIIIIYFLMTNFKDIEKKITEQKLSLFENFRQGIKFFLSSRQSFFLILSMSLLMTEGSIYGGLLMIPMYNTYLGSDYLISIVFSFNLLVSLFAKLFLLDKLIKRSKNINNVNKYFILSTIFYFLAPTLFIVYPYNNSFDLFGIALLVTILTTADTVAIVSIVLLQRQIRIIVPSNIRNSIYSLMSSISTLMVIVYIPIITNIYENGSLINALIVDLSIYFLIIVFIVITTLSRNKVNKLKAEIPLVS
jgi:MFS family permease